MDIYLSDGYNESGFLRTLSESYQGQLETELTEDCDLYLDGGGLIADDLLSPLQVGSFPASKIGELKDVLMSALCKYASDPSLLGTGSFKRYYVSALYLECFTREQTGRGLSTPAFAIALLAREAFPLGNKINLQSTLFLSYLLKQANAGGLPIDYVKTFLQIGIALCMSRMVGGFLAIADEHFSAELQALGYDDPNTWRQTPLEAAVECLRAGFENSRVDPSWLQLFQQFKAKRLTLP